MINEITNNLSKFYKELVMAIRTGFSKPIILDTLTGLPTLISFKPYLIQAMSKGKVGVLYIDIENFTGVEATIAGVINNNFKSNLELGEVAAELKKIAKRQQGSNYLGNQRCHLNPNPLTLQINL